MSSKLKLALESAKAIAKNIRDGKDLKVSEQVFKTRLETCGGCNKFNPNMQRCDECGCFLQVKAKLSGMKCPLNKWKE